MSHGLTLRRRTTAVLLGSALVLGAGGTAAVLMHPSASPAAAKAAPGALGEAGAAVVLRSARDVAPVIVSPELPPLSEVATPELAPVQPPTYAKKAATTVSTKDVHVLLARRTVALRKHDEKGFLATFDAGRPALVATQRTLYRNLVKLPLVAPSYQESGVTGSATSRRAYVSLLHQFRGVDSEAAELTKVETFVRRKGAVVTTAVAAVRGMAATRYAPLDQVPLTVREGRLVTVVSTPDAGDVSGVAGAAEQAARDVRATWGSRPGPARFVVFATRDQRAVGTWFGAGSAPFQAAGATMLQVAIKHPTRFAGARVIVDVSQSSGEQLYRVLRHEFTHAVDGRVQTVPKGRATQNFPTWVEEGLATWVEELDVPVGESTYVKALRNLRQYWNRRLPPDQRDSFYVDGPRGAYNYCVAASVYRYVGSRWGAAKAIAFYSAYAAGKPAAAYTALGTNRAAFTAGWAAWVDRQLAG